MLRIRAVVLRGNGLLFMSRVKDPEIIVIGAGAAGLAASIKLAQAGLAVTVIEARDRIGGRIFTLQDPVYENPVELGAEFIHGKPPEIWNLLRRRKIKITEVEGDNWCAVDRQLTTCDFFSEIDEILGQMNSRKRDQSFLDFLEDCCPNSKNNPHVEQAKQRAIGYVSGFNAADPALVGVHWLLKEMRAEEKIEGDRIFRSQHGYTDLMNVFQQQLNSAGVTVLKSTIVGSILWRRGQIEIGARGVNGTSILSAPRVLITVPLGVLQAGPNHNGAIRFTPDLPRSKQDAIHNIVMGKVTRVTLRFRRRFWEDLPKPRGTAQRKRSKTMADLSFLFSRDEWFPTWWTPAPHKLPFLVGWAPFRCAERLSGKPEAFVVEHALKALRRILGVSPQELETLLEHAYLHDWQNDPFSRGAYSYGKVGGDGAEHALGRPVENTLFFAGEATDTAGHNGTVHGAIASGHRAADEILKAAKTKSGVAKTKSGARNSSARKHSYSK